ncbi:unnamed protein product [Heterosigma akashiwo]
MQSDKNEPLTQQPTVVNAEQPTVVYIEGRLLDPHLNPERPPNYCWLSVLTCLCCFWPLGLAACFYSSTVDAAFEQGDYERAKHNSEVAKNLSLASIMVAVLVSLIMSTAYGSGYFS